MADIKISALPAATTPLAGTEVLPIVQSGVTVKVAVSNLTAGRAVALGATTITGAATISTTLGVTGVSTFAAGSAALPALTTTGDTDTGVWFPAANTVAASTGGTERIRINSTGNLGIGLTSYNLPLSVVADSNGQNVQLNGRTGDSLGQMFFRNFGGTNNLASISSDSSGDLYFGAGSQTAPTVPTSRMYIQAAGNVGIGTSSPSTYGKLAVSVGNNSFMGATTSSGAGGGWQLNTYYLAVKTNYIDCEVTVGTPASEASVMRFATIGSGTLAERMRIDNTGNVGIGTTTPAYKLEISTDSAGKPGVGGLWTVVSDERIKANIVPADLDRCYEIVKSVPLKHFGFAPGVYTDDQIQDKHNLGWIAQDVQKVFKNAVSVKPFTLKTDIPDGVEEYEEQDFTLETVEKTETSIQVINGKAVQVSKVVKSENKVLVFDTVDVLDEAGAVVMDGDKPLTYQMPRMITKTRPKVRHDVIKDCLDLNSGQMIAALYGAVQALMAKVETLK